MKTMLRTSLIAAAALSAAAHAEPLRLSFDEAVSRALKNNPTTAQAQAEIRRAEAVVTEVRAAMLPTLSGNVTGTLLDGDRTSGGAVVQPSPQVNANLQLAVPLVVPQKWVNTSRAKDQVGIARSGAAETDRQIAFSAAQAYLTAVLQQHLLDTAIRARDVAQNHLDFAHQRLVHGLGTRLDESRAEKEVHDDAARVANAQAGLARAQEALGVLVGVDVPVLPAGEVNLPGLPGTDQALTGVDTRSDVVTAKERLALAQRIYDESWLDYMPTLSALAQPFVNSPGTVTAPGSGWQAQLVFSVPLFDGGFRYGARRDREAQRDQARLALEELERQGHSEVRTAFDQLTAAQTALSEAETSAKVANETLSLATTAYRAGASSNLEVIDAERNARDAEEAASVARDSESQARLSLVVASGKFPTSAH